jgi:DnaK suppressor protein
MTANQIPQDPTAIRAQLASQLVVLKARLGRIDDHLHNRNREVPTDSEERATFNNNEEVVEALEPRTIKEIAALESAIERLDRGEWQSCASCHKPIEPKRLALLPTTETCSVCARLA